MYFARPVNNPVGILPLISIGHLTFLFAPQLPTKHIVFNQLSLLRHICSLVVRLN